MYYWLQKGDRWTIDTDLSAVDWTDQDTQHCILPAELVLKEGPDPHEITFLVKADQAYASSSMFPPIASGLLVDQRPDGYNEGMSMPSCEAEGPATFKPFELVRLMASADKTKADPECKFMGIILGATLDVGQEEWTVRAYDLVRWYLTKVYHTGISYQPPIDEAAPTFIENSFPIYNEDGEADQLVTIDEEGEEVNTTYFTATNLNSYDGLPNPLWGGNYAGYWTLGTVLNQLREMYHTNAALYGKPDLSKIMDWPEAEANFPFLYTLDGINQVCKHFAIGGLSLNEILDNIVRRAGRYTWGTVLDPATMKHRLTIYSIDTGDETLGVCHRDLSRGAFGGRASTGPYISSGTVSYDWSDCVTKVSAYGMKERWETTIGYGEADPDGAPMEGYILLPDWTTLEQDNYKLAEKLGDLVSKYDTVFQRFRIAKDTGWDVITGHDSKCGPRRLLSELLTQDADLSEDEQHRKIKLRLWRWDSSSNTYSEAPDTVSVHMNRDMTVEIRGHDADDDPIQNAKGKRMYPRYLCKVPTEEGLWTVWPFRLTIAVEDDRRLTGESENKPPEWPDLYEAAEVPDAYQENRISALHGTRDNGGVKTPAQNDYTHITYMDADAAVTLHDDQAKVDVVADRTVKARNRPMAAGQITWPDHDWTMHPGAYIDILTGGSVDDRPPIPDVHLYAHVRAVTFLGLGAEVDGQRRMVIEMGVH